MQIYVNRLDSRVRGNDVIGSWESRPAFAGMIQYDFDFNKLVMLPLDDAVGTAGLFYARFMDDWVIIVPGRWKLRRIVKIVNTVLNRLKIEKHPDKTFIGMAIKGFDFLGYRVKPGKLSVSQSTIRRHFEHIDRLYEQGADYNRVRQYVRRWFDWLKAGIEPHFQMSVSAWSWQSSLFVRQAPAS